jgi:mercuric ion binding protein
MKHLTFAVAALMLGLGATVTSVSFVQSASAAATALAQATFYVDNMTCGLCPATVKAAMSGVKGVQSVEVDPATKTAHVVFDPSLTDAAAIASASEQAGYPAAVQG